MREELTSVDPPRSFGYRLTGIKGPMALLVGSVAGEWSFTPAAAAPRSPGAGPSTRSRR